MQLGTATLLVSLTKGAVHLHCLCLRAEEREEMLHLAEICLWEVDVQVLDLTLELVLMLVESS